MRKYETHAFICKLIFTKHIDPITFFLYTIKPKHDAHPFLIGLKLSLSKGLTSFCSARQGFWEPNDLELHAVNLERDDTDCDWSQLDRRHSIPTAGKCFRLR